MRLIKAFVLSPLHAFLLPKQYQRTNSDTVTQCGWTRALHGAWPSASHTALKIRG